MVSLLLKTFDRYAISIYTGLIILGYEAAYWLHFSFSNTIGWLIVCILFICALSKSSITLLLLPLMGSLFHGNATGILDLIHPIWIFKIQNWIRLQLEQTQFDSKLQSMANALILGDTSDISYQQKILFKELSIIHVIAISGMHLQIISFYLGIPFKLITKHPKLYSILSIITIWLFALIANGNPSIVRACAQFHYLKVAHLYHRRIISINKITSSILAIFILSPKLIHNVGLQLSIAAILGIQYIYPLLYKGLRFENKVLIQIWQSVCVTMSAQLMCMPLIAYYMKKIYTQFLLTNLILSPLFTLLLHLFILLLCTSYIPLIQSLITSCIENIYALITILSHTLFQKLPHNAIIVNWNFVFLIYIYAAYLICIIWVQQKKPKMLIWLLLLTCLLKIFQYAPMGIK